MVGIHLSKLLSPNSFGSRNWYSRSHTLASHHACLHKNQDRLPIISWPTNYNRNLKRATLASENSVQFGTRNYFSQSLALTNYVSRRYVQEFPSMKVDNSQPKDHVLILPEPFEEHLDSNEILRIPKAGEPEIDFTKFNAESVYKGLSYAICQFENFITDSNNGFIGETKSAREFFKDIEARLYPLDTAYNILMVLLNVKPQEYSYIEIHELVGKCIRAREKRVSDKFKQTIESFLPEDLASISSSDKKMLQLYHPLSLKRIQRQDHYLMDQYQTHLRNETSSFLTNLTGANQLFSHTVDDPDILAVVSSEFDDCKDLHHKERTPLKITNATYRRFMQVCPDRFVRQNLWLTRNKRCSPKALPRYNNVSVCTNIRIFRRKIANLAGFRTHADLKIEDAMAKSKQQILDNLKSLNIENASLINDRLQELNDFASDNSFEDPGQLGIQEYDTDFWIHKYMFDILIGKSEKEVKAYFPLPVVMQGLQKYFKEYFDINLETLPKQESAKLWAPGVQIMDVSRKGQLVGRMIYDPYQRDDKRLSEPSYARIRGRNNDLGCLPLRFISSSFKLDPIKQQAHLSLPDIMNLFYSYALVLQRLLYNYDFYELNTQGCLEVDANNLLPNLCVAHLLTDYRILQSCSDRGGSKPIDAESASRIMKAFTYFKSFRTWHELYKAHLDIEAHSNLTDIKSIIRDVHPIYSPFPRDPDNYDYCAMAEIFVGPNDGSQYADLWSKQMANFCLSSILTQNNASDMVSLDVDKIQDFNDRLLDNLFDPNDHDTNKKLVSLVGRNFEPSKAGLGVL